MNPVGLPFLAGRMVTLRISPGFMEVLLIPSRVSVVYGGSGQNPVRHLAILLRDCQLDARVRICKIQLLEHALEDHLFVQVVHTRHGMMGLQGDAGYDKADHQESAHYKESSGS